MKKICYVLLAAAMITACKKESAPVKTSTTSATTSPRAATTLSFSGYTWNISAPSGQVSPGPNYWNASYAWVDASGYLHLKAAYDATTGHWECAEVYTTQSLGYGTYQWQVEGTLGSFDKNIV